MNLEDIREAFRNRFGYGETGTRGNRKFLTNANLALREMWPKIPEVLRRFEYRLPLVPAITDGLVSVHPDDPLVLVVDGAAALLRTDGTLRGRWVEVYAPSGLVFARRVRDVFSAFDKADAYSNIVLDEPWTNTTDTGMKYRIFTYDYPLAADVQDVLRVNRCTLSGQPGLELTQAMLPAELARERLERGWAAAGPITGYARGDYANVPAPHYTPEVAYTVVLAEPTGNNWGYDNAGVERRDTFPGVRYGAAGTFSYKACHVHGRWPGANPLQSRTLPPFYLSEASPASDQITTTWGAAGVRVSVPDIDYVYGYGADQRLPSYQHHGTEVWLFRARHASESPTAGSNHAAVKLVEKDGIYYLWKIIQGGAVTVIDTGDADPVDRRFMLRDHNGHHSIRFDATPSAPEDVLVTALRRPHLLENEGDALRLPIDSALAPFLELLASYFTGDRDGEPNRRGDNYARYLALMEELRRAVSISKAPTTAFGDGISPRSSGTMRFGPIQ